MPHTHGVMLLRLLRLLMLPTLCSAILLPNSSKAEDGGSLPDPNTYYWIDPDEEGSSNASGSSANSRNGPLLPPPPGEPIPPSGNYTNILSPSRAYMTMNPVIPPITDTAICDYLLNSPVPPPVDQIPFYCLCSYCKGTGGPKGDTGDRGPPGAPGSPGMRGLTGFTGRPGFTGPPGMKGQKGDLGEKGQLGPAGFEGTKGERGFKGEKGDRGMMGPPGEQGLQGETGTCPATCETIQGPPGLQGLTGPSGPRGLPGIEGPVGAKGVKGDKGDMGIPGEPGLNGQKGNQGEQGLCNCTNGVNGTDGKAGEKGAKGEKGDMGAQGVQGLMGLKGNQGIIGPIGPPGPCSPTIQSAFSASIQQPYPLENQPIAFLNVFTNHPGHFNPSLGIYTAPVNGTYFFSYHLAVANRILKVGLFRNLFPIVRTTEINQEATASQSIILHLNSGDQVWLQVKNAITNGIFTDSESSSTFSGYLLYPDSCELPLGRDFESPPQYQKGDFSWYGPIGNTMEPPSTPYYS